MILEIQTKYRVETINTDDISTISKVYCDANWGTSPPYNWRFVYTYFNIHKKNGSVLQITVENGWDKFFDSLAYRNVNDGGLMWMKFQETESCKKSIEEAESKRNKILECWGGQVVKI